MAGSAMPASVVAELAAAARDYLRMADGVEAALLARLGEAALLLAEQFCGEVLIARPFEAVLPVTGVWQRLPMRPVTAIAGVTALPAGQAPAVLPVGACYLDIDPDGDGWVRIVDAGGAGQVAVACTAGRATTLAAVPAPVAQGAVALVAHLFEHRDGAALPPAAVAALWRPFRQLRLAPALTRATTMAGRP